LTDREESQGFLVDGTAGRLARWLRILGLDADYVSTGDAAEIARRARRSGRTVITRNRLLAKRLGGQAMLLSSDRLDDQIEQVVEAVGRERCAPFSRCSLCNVRLVPIPRDLVRGRVPDYVWRHHRSFALCPLCGRYYWRGTHSEKMQQVIDRTVGKLPGGAAS
jgi:uncharacterized protein with PIN domain